MIEDESSAKAMISEFVASVRASCLQDKMHSDQELDPKKLPPVCCQPRHTIIEKNEVIKNL